MHTWLPDGHGQAPAPVSALLSGVMLKSALYAILRFYTVTNLCLGDSKLTSRSLLAVGLLSLVLATPFILKRNRFKRVLAYHSLEHMGIITFGIGIGVPVALFGALLHTLNHALTKALMFLVYGLIQYEYQDRCGTDYNEGDDEQNIHGVLRVMPLSATILAFGGLALVGSPPFNIFMSEFIILWAAIMESSRQPFYYAAVILFVLTVTLIFGGLVGHLSRLLLGSAPFQPVETDVRRILKLTPFFALVIIIFLFGLIVPNWPVNLPAILQRSVLILNNGVSLPIDLGMR
jgi:hydrogenase-4 component F